MQPAALSPRALEVLAAEAPFAEVTESEVADAQGQGYDVLKMLVAAGLAASNGAARRLLEQGGISLNKRRLTAQERYVAPENVLLSGGHVILGKGRRDYAVLRIIR